MTGVLLDHCPVPGAGERSRRQNYNGSQRGDASFHRPDRVSGPVDLSMTVSDVVPRLVEKRQVMLGYQSTLAMGDDVNSPCGIPAVDSLDLREKLKC